MKIVVTNHKIDNFSKGFVNVQCVWLMLLNSRSSLKKKQWCKGPKICKSLNVEVHSKTFTCFF